jgi:mannosyltransferase OCH1-like enzyme
MFKNINNTIENSYFNNITIYSNTFQFDFSQDYNLENNVNNIPRILHLIWIGKKEEPSYVREHLLKWKKLMPNWQIILWTNDDLVEEKFPLKFLDLLNKVNSGAQKADILRYFIIEKYGGVYVDVDIIPNKSLDPIITQLFNTSLVICHDLEITWAYIINAFFAAVPNHPVLKTACELCINNIVINTEDIHMHSGPRLFGECILLNEKSDIICLPSNFFYHNLNNDNRFGMHIYAKNW